MVRKKLRNTRGSTRGRSAYQKYLKSRVTSKRRTKYQKYKKSRAQRLGKRS